MQDRYFVSLCDLLYCSVKKHKNSMDGEKITYNKYKAISLSIRFYLPNMQGPQQLLFTPNPETPYKIISAVDPNKCFTLQDNTHKLVITDYHAQPNQLFKIFQNNNKYAFVNPALDAALHVEGNNKNDGGVVKADPGQHESSFFFITPVEKGQWATKACHINTFSQGKTLDIKGGKANPNTDICQWKFHGGVNQSWLVIPADNLPQQQGEKTQTQQVQQVQQPVHPDLPAVFAPKPNTPYKVVSVLDENKCLTVNQEGKLQINTFKNEPTQIFQIREQNNKFAFVVQSQDSALCIFQDKADNGAQIIVDKDQHPSSWFEASLGEKGKWAKKAYLIKTHAGNRALDIAGGKAEDGKNVLQYNIHQGDNQLWHFVPIEPESPNKKGNKKAGKVAQKPTHPDVKPQFEANPKILYKIFSILNPNMVLTVNKDNKLEVDKHHNHKNQHFHIYTEGNKFAFVAQHNDHGLCIFEDKQDNALNIITDAGKHTSSWFEITRVEKGDFANKGYIIKTHANGRCLDIAGGKAEEGKAVLQYNIHEGGNQVWLIEPLKGEKLKDANKQKGFKWGQELVNVHHIIPKAQVGDSQGMGFVQTVSFKPNQHYIIYAAHSNGIKALDVAQDMANYGQVIMYSFHGAPNQRFVFEQEGQMYRIKNVKENKYINVTNDGPHDGIWIRCDEKGLNQSQLWTIVPATEPQYAGKNAVHIRSVFGKALETPADSLENNVKIQQGTFHCSDGQTWIIKEI